MKLISVWGSPSSGKTTITLELGKMITRETGKNCLILFTDDQCSPLSYLFPSLSGKGGSLGNIITTAGFYQEELKKSLVYHKDNTHLCFLGFRNEETRFNYSSISEIQVIDLFVSLGQLVDYVLVDCMSNIMDDPISQYALKEGSCIQVGGGDLKSIAFFKNTQFLTREYSGIRDNCTKVVNNPWDFDTWKTIADHHGQVEYSFPFCMDIQENYLEEKNIDDLKLSKVSRTFVDELVELTHNLIDTEHKSTVEKKSRFNPKKIRFTRKKDE